MEQATGLVYLHGNNVLHNDIKSDNILLDKSSYQSILVDFGESCFVDGKIYKLSDYEQHRYSLEHLQVAPDLQNGHCKQSQLILVIFILWVWL